MDLLRAMAGGEGERPAARGRLTAFPAADRATGGARRPPSSRRAPRPLGAYQGQRAGGGVRVWSRTPRAVRGKRRVTAAVMESAEQRRDQRIL